MGHPSFSRAHNVRGHAWQIWAPAATWTVEPPAHAALRQRGGGGERGGRAGDARHKAPAPARPCDGPRGVKPVQRVTGPGPDRPPAASGDDVALSAAVTWSSAEPSAHGPVRTTVVITTHDQAHPTSGDDGPPARTAVAMDDPLAGLEPGRADRARRVARARLRAWRLQTMRQRGWRNSAYRVITDKTLDSILARWPTTSAELRACYGIGRGKQSDWQDKPNPPGVTPLLTALGPRPRAAIGVAPPPGDVAPRPAAHAAAATAAAAPPTAAAGRPRSPAVARAHATAAQARRGRETAAASRLRARLVAGPAFGARASPLRWAIAGHDTTPNGVPGSVLRTDVTCIPERTPTKRSSTSRSAAPRPAASRPSPHHRPPHDATRAAVPASRARTTSDSPATTRATWRLPSPRARPTRGGQTTPRWSPRHQESGPPPPGWACGGARSPAARRRRRPATWP